MSEHLLTEEERDAIEAAIHDFVGPSVIATLRNLLLRDAAYALDAETTTTGGCEMSEQSKIWELEFLPYVDGMTFLGKPVQEMTAQELLVVVGYLRAQNLHHEKERIHGLLPVRPLIPRVR